MPSPETATLEEHKQIHSKYVSLTWQLWREQYKVQFFVWHPIPEEHLRIEVVKFWRGETSQVSGWTDILGQILSPIKDAISSGVHWIWDHIIYPVISTLVAGLDWLIRGVMDAQAWTFNVLNSIASLISNNTNWIINQVTSGVYWIVELVSSGFTWVTSQLSSGFTWVISHIQSGVGWIWNQMLGYFSTIADVLKQIGVWIINAIKTYVLDPLLAALTPIYEGLKALVVAIWNFITGGIMARSPQEWRGSYLRWLGIIAGVSVMAGSGFVAAAIFDMAHPFKDTRAKEIAEFALRFSGVAWLQAAFFTTFFDIACAKPVRQELNNIFTPEIPGSGDLIRFVVREVIVPDEFHMAMSLQGFSRYWSEAYWEAHWILPPPDRTRTLFLRKKIPEAEYRKFLIWYDFKPDPRPGISLSDVDIMLESQYDWPGRIETRWMLEWGEISAAEAEDLLKAEGLDPAWSPRVARAYLLNQLRDEYNRVRMVLMTRRREGFLKTEAFREALKALNFAAHTIEASIKWADEAAKWDEIWEQVQEWWRLAKARRITPEKYAEEMRSLGMVEEKITSKMSLLRKLAEIAKVK